MIETSKSANKASTPRYGAVVVRVIGSIVRDFEVMAQGVLGRVAVMEVNSSPGLEGIEQATGKDIGAMIFEPIEKTHNRIQPRLGGKANA
jgi:hypothetical protein|tara:strand:- start:1695 stop:1964 length:270 start_codon:yes stop_codon:yes gene_type:complete